MKTSIYLFRIVLTLCIIFSNSSCNNKSNDKKNENVQKTSEDCEFVDVRINMSQEQYDSIRKHLTISKMIVLKESDDVMFADIDKIIEDNGSYYILDSFGARTLVSFDSNGTAIARFGKIGHGPGEYVRPWDFDIYNSHVYILDSNTKKILKFGKDGTFIDEQNIPFIARAFKFLGNGDILFSLQPDGDGSPRLCMADNSLSEFSYFLNSEKGYVGGFHTNDIFRNISDGIMYYESPLDTLFLINSKGHFSGGFVFDFGNKHVPHEAKLDYLKARENGLLENTLRLNNSPIHLNDGIIVGTVADEDSQYILLADTRKNLSGLHECKPSESIYEIIEPVTVDSKGNLVCYTCKEFLEEADDYNSLPDSLKSDLADNEYVLMLYSTK